MYIYVYYIPHYIFNSSIYENHLVIHFFHLCMPVINYVPCKSLHLFYFLLPIMLLYCYYCCFVVIAIIYYISVVLPIVLFFFHLYWMIDFFSSGSFFSNLSFLFLFFIISKSFLFLIKLSSIISICSS